MPTATEYEIVKHQVNSFAARGYITTFEMLGMDKDAAPRIIIANRQKSWRFSDPDWHVVSRQLARLYMILTKKRVRHEAYNKHK